MFRCGNCGSGYSMRSASWESCPRCLAKDRINVPLSFELGWRGSDRPSEEIEDRLMRSSADIAKGSTAAAT
jgi:hypothetical protein